MGSIIVYDVRGQGFQSREVPEAVETIPMRNGMQDKLMHTSHRKVPFKRR